MGPEPGVSWLLAPWPLAPWLLTMATERSDGVASEVANTKTLIESFWEKAMSGLTLRAN